MMLPPPGRRSCAHQRGTVAEAMSPPSRTTTSATPPHTARRPSSSHDSASAAISTVARICDSGSGLDSGRPIIDTDTEGVGACPLPRSSSIRKLADEFRGCGEERHREGR